MYGQSGLRPDAYLHELGHMVSFSDNNKMQKEFNTKFSWTYLFAAAVPKDIQDAVDKTGSGEDIDHRVLVDGPKVGLANGKWYIRKNRYDQSQG